MNALKALAAVGSAAVLMLGPLVLPAQATALATAGWAYSGAFDTLAQCNLDRALRHSQGYPTDPTAGCYRNSAGYYYYYYV